MKSISLSLFILFLISMSSPVYNQDSIPKYGIDSVQCLRNLTLFNSLYKENKYQEALPYWRMVFNDCPAANKVIYSGGEKIFKHRINKESNAEIKTKYTDTLIMIFDRRIQYFGDDPKYPVAWIKGQKAKTLYLIKKDTDASYELLGESISELAENTPADFMLYLIKISTVKLQKKTMEIPEAFDNYFEMHSLIENALKNEPDEKTTSLLVSAAKNIDDLFAKWPIGDCNQLGTYLDDRLSNQQSDVFTLKTIIRILQSKNCTELPVFFKTIDKLAETDPGAIDPEKLGDIYSKREAYIKALDYYETAIKHFEEDQNRLAEIYLKMAKISGLKLRQPAKSRSLAYKALEYNPNWGLPYILIANLYSSATQTINNEACFNNTTMWIAVDMLNKAKSVDPGVSSKVDPDIAKYTLSFPLRGDAHFCDVKEGDTYKVGGWINESTTARFSD